VYVRTQGHIAGDKNSTILLWYTHTINDHHRMSVDLYSVKPSLSLKLRLHSELLGSAESRLDGRITSYMQKHGQSGCGGHM